MAEKDWIQKYFAPLASGAGAAGLLDDVAVLDASGPTIVTSDALVEGVHFRRADPLASVAHKLVRVNVSDCLASGAIPHEALLTLGWPSKRSEDDLAQFAAGLGEACTDWGISLVGGDTVTHTGALFISLTLTAKCVSAAPVRRSGANIGDEIWLSGQIGAAKLGYEALVAGNANTLALAYQMPAIPSLSIAQLISQCATAAMDVSDGLLVDLNSLAKASSVGMDIDLDAVPFAGEPKNIDEKIAFATWGDDYQCSFTATAESHVVIREYAASKGISLTKIGHVRAGHGIVVSSKGSSINLPERLGFEHS